MSENTTVSVIIPTFNRSGFLRMAIQSVARQTYQDWECIIVDDGSTDNTREIVDGLARQDGRMKYFFKENGGQGSARNLGLEKARGEFIAFLDSDDEWLPEKLERQITLLLKNPKFDFCYTADIILDEKTGRRAVKRWNHVGDLSFVKLAGIAVSVPSSHLYKKEVFQQVGLFDTDRCLIGLEDNDWSLRGHYLRGYYLDEALTIYRLHGGQITQGNINERIERQIAGLSYVLEKNSAVIAKNKKALAFRQLQIGHLHMLAGHRSSARKYFLMALRSSGGVRAAAFMVSSLLPRGLYGALNRYRKVRGINTNK